MSKFVLLLVWVVVSSGCYFFYPRVPKQRIAKVEGARTEVSTNRETLDFSCTPGDSRCTTNASGDTREYVGITAVRTYYNGKQASQFDIQSIVDPQFEAKIAAIEGKKMLCNLSIVPSAVAIVGLGMLAYAAFKPEAFDDVQRFRLISLGVMGGGALASLPLGGFACWQAKRKWDAMFPTKWPGRSYFTLKRSGPGENGAYYDDLKRLSDAYNARFGASSPGPRSLEMRGLAAN